MKIGAANANPCPLGVSSRSACTPTSDTFVRSPQRSAPKALQVGKHTYALVEPRALRPGDIGFTYDSGGQTWRQALIYWVQRLVGYAYPGALHAFIVVGCGPPGHFAVADAADGTGICVVDLNVSQDGLEDDFADDTTFIFLRMRDPEVADAMGHTAWNWAHVANDGFSMHSVFMAPFRTPALADADVPTLCAIVDQATLSRPLREADGVNPHRMMCAQFVGNVGVAATLMVYKRRARLEGPTLPAHLQGLLGGPSGHAFACDPRSQPPAALYGRLIDDAAVQKLGYVTRTPRPQEPSRLAQLAMQCRTQLALPRLNDVFTRCCEDIGRWATQSA